MAEYMSEKPLWKCQKVYKDLDHIEEEDFNVELMNNPPSADQDNIYERFIPCLETIYEDEKGEEENAVIQNIPVCDNKLKNHVFEDQVVAGVIRKRNSEITTFPEEELEDDVFESSCSGITDEAIDVRSREAVSARLREAVGFRSRESVGVRLRHAVGAHLRETIVVRLKEAAMYTRLRKSVGARFRAGAKVSVIQSFGEATQTSVEPLKLESSPTFKYSRYLTDKEKRQLRSMFCGLKTKVYVCGCAVTTHFIGPTLTLQNKDQNWEKQFYGVPVVVLEKEEPTNKLWLYIAERGTGLPLWREQLTFQSAYSRESSTFHMLSISKNHCMKLGLKFDCETSATVIWLQISRWTSRLENINVSLPCFGGGGSPSSLTRTRWWGRQNKLKISTPYCFQHITSVLISDQERFHSVISTSQKESVSNTSAICRNPSIEG